MTWGLVAVAGATVVGGYMASKSASKAASSASAAQSRAADAQIAESQRQFDAIQELLKPYSEAGTGALAQQKALIGLGGAEAQQQAISALENSPTMQALTQQGETGILQNASATGGLRGGNVQAALAQFRPQLLSQLIQQQYSNLGGLVSVGQNAAAGVGNAGQNSSNQIIAALGQQGAAQAGNALAQGQAQAGMWNNIAGTASMLGTMKLLGKF
jgi:hypothetical protein